MVRYFGQASGRVQGVGFRFFVQQNSLELGLTGWVRNMSDGTVTMEVQGEQEAVDELAGRIRKGNLFVKVKSLSLEGEDVVPDEKGFSIRY
ncbi:MAG: acylphosphatase [Selenomonadaceae bacterium]|nr:acylphosphatase [Selenomonadaceae bacterium]